MKNKKKKYKIVFHKDFKKGKRLWLCLNCGYPVVFMGVPMISCDCKKPKPKIYTMDKLDDFILKLQEIHFYKKKKIDARKFIDWEEVVKEKNKEIKKLEKENIRLKKTIRKKIRRKK